MVLHVYNPFSKDVRIWYRLWSLLGHRKPLFNWKEQLLAAIFFLKILYKYFCLHSFNVLNLCSASEKYRSESYLFVWTSLHLLLHLDWRNWIFSSAKYVVCSFTTSLSPLSCFPGWKGDTELWIWASPMRPWLTWRVAWPRFWTSRCCPEICQPSSDSCSLKEPSLTVPIARYHEQKVTG